MPINVRHQDRPVSVNDVGKVDSVARRELRRMGEGVRSVDREETGRLHL